MAQDILQVEYDALEEIVSKFQQSAEENDELQNRLSQMVGLLAQGGWQGKGSAAFFAEMQDNVLPGHQRLIQSLQEASQVVGQLRHLYEQAEEEAAQVLHMGESGNAVGGDRDRSGKKQDGDLRITHFEKVKNGKLFIAGDSESKTVTFKVPFFLRPFLGGQEEIVYTTGAIHPNDISQGQLGDCFLVSSLAATADQNPALIRKAIQDNGDGTYTVTFYEKKGGILGIGARYEPVKVTVTPDLPVGEQYSEALGKWIPQKNPHLSPADVGPQGEAEIWPHVIEKAYAQWQGNGDAARGFEILDQGGHSHKVLEALAGKDSIDKDPDHYSISQLAEMDSKGQAIMLSSLPSAEGKNSWYHNDTLVRGHAYWVESVDEKAGTITVRNPWGYDDSKKNKIVISYDDLDDNFRRITINPLR